jgi:hypothetical protein
VPLGLLSASLLLAAVPLSRCPAVPLDRSSPHILRSECRHARDCDPNHDAKVQLLLPAPHPRLENLQHDLARLAIHFVSGPGAITSALRRALLGGPLNGKSVILDVGYSDTIPDAIRKAVIARDKGCAWPGGCNRRPAACDVHHVKHKKHGGQTS